jgi:hypothetical protein
MKRLATSIFAALAFISLLGACQESRAEGILERIEGKLDKLLAAGSVPPIIPPSVDPVPPGNPTTPPPAGKPLCFDGGPHLINGFGTVNNVCTCTPVVVSVHNAIPGSRLIVTKQPGAGSPAVPPGMVSISEGGRLVGICGSTCPFDIGLGDRDFTFRSEVPCTNLTVQVRGGERR